MGPVSQPLLVPTAAAGIWDVRYMCTYTECPDAPKFQSPPASRRCCTCTCMSCYCRCQELFVDVAQPTAPHSFLYSLINTLDWSPYFHLFQMTRRLLFHVCNGQLGIPYEPIRRQREKSEEKDTRRFQPHPRRTRLAGVRRVSKHLSAFPMRLHLTQAFREVIRGKPSYKNTSRLQATARRFVEAPSIRQKWPVEFLAICKNKKVLIDL